jgi:SAM-dependent methyltransferase
MNKLKKIIWSVSNKNRQKRAEIFRGSFDFDEATKILDIGSESGENINLALRGTKVLPGNVYIADINGDEINKGKDKFGFQPVLIYELNELPFEDKFFDIVYCSSVIEHVTVPKEKVWEIVSESEFQKKAWEKQKLLAREINRVGRQFFVQTPARGFPIETHTWLPFVGYLSRPLQIKVMTLTNKFWIKEAIPDFNLLDEKQMAELFPDAEIVFEKKFGFVKSIMAIKSLR